MINGFCHSGNWGFLGDIGNWGWIGLILNLAFWIAVLAGLILLVVWAIRRARVPAGNIPDASGQPTAKEIIQAR